MREIDRVAILEESDNLACGVLTDMEGYLTVQNDTNTSRFISVCDGVVAKLEADAELVDREVAPVGVDPAAEAFFVILDLGYLGLQSPRQDRRLRAAIAIVEQSLAER